jgi:hypothetical protein
MLGEIKASVPASKHKPSLEALHYGGFLSQARFYTNPRILCSASLLQLSCGFFQGVGDCLDTPRLACYARGVGGGGAGMGAWVSRNELRGV